MAEAFFFICFRAGRRWNVLTSFTANELSTFHRRNADRVVHQLAARKRGDGADTEEKQHPHRQQRWQQRWQQRCTPLFRVCRRSIRYCRCAINAGHAACVERCAPTDAHRQRADWSARKRGRLPRPALIGRRDSAGRFRPSESDPAPSQ